MTNKNGIVLLFIFMIMGFCFLTLDMAQGIEVALNPIPQRLFLGKGEGILSPCGIIIIGETPSEPVRYIAEKISSELKYKYNLDYQVVARMDRKRTELSQITFSKEGSDLPQEGFTLEVKLAGRSRLVTIDLTGRDDRGLVYAGYAFLGLLHKRGKEVVVPVLRLSDWPALRNRFPQAFHYADRTVCKPAGYDFSLWLENNMDWLLRYRYNSIAVWPYPEHSDNKNQPLVLNKELARKIHRRGLRFLVVWNYLYDFAKQGRCLCNPSDVKWVLDEIERFIEAGADQILIMYDDIADWTRDFNYCHCAKCQAKFGDPATEQLFMMEKIVALVKQLNPKIELFFCPTVYSPWGMTRKNYFLADQDDYNTKIGAAPCLKGIKKFYAFFRAEESINQLKKFGLKKDFAFWWNGVRPRTYGRYVRKNEWYDNNIFFGFPSLYWGWYTNLYPFYPEIRLTPDAISEMKRLAERTDTAILCTGGDGHCMEYNDAIFGLYAWNPAAFDQADGEAQIVDDIFGRGAYENYLKRAYQVYLKGLNYYLTPLDHNPESLTLGEDYLKNVPEAVRLVRKAKKFLESEKSAIPYKIARFYLNDFEKGLIKTQRNVKLLVDAERARFQKTVDFVAFGLSHWSSKSGDIYDIGDNPVMATPIGRVKNPDADDLDNSMGLHQARVNSKEDIDILSCNQAEWEFTIPGQGKYTLYLMGDFGKDKTGLISYKLRDKWVDLAAFGAEIKDTSKPVSLELPVISGKLNKILFRFQSPGEASIYNAWLDRIE